MRARSINFEQLVQQNKQEILEDKKRIKQIEMRLEKKQEDLVKRKLQEMK
ncbi:FbpB family small basic protein [Oceanobacillus halophilus]|uniref:FbpB family small basic protein n=1 Tax=Oceanobacillus halophilus TaxID=930130 RepID=A0A495ADP7_9BACI|nr:FbpB family small basic protein [Oceanobacillus halophilus]RKQ37972.1 FbpB family small basic protein [Oceanobacillus halophilus]